MESLSPSAATPPPNFKIVLLKVLVFLYGIKWRIVFTCQKVYFLYVGHVSGFTLAQTLFEQIPVITTPTVPPPPILQPIPTPLCLCLCLCLSVCLSVSLSLSVFLLPTCRYNHNFYKEVGVCWGGGVKTGSGSLVSNLLNSLISLIRRCLQATGMKKNKKTPKYFYHRCSMSWQRPLLAVFLLRFDMAGFRSNQQR